jgi:hypothetical protein
LGFGTSSVCDVFALFNIRPARVLNPYRQKEKKILRSSHGRQYPITFEG